MKAKIKPNKLLNKTTLLLFTLLFAGIGTYLIVGSKAATNTYTCQGRSFYIDYETGSDTNSGTKINPWKRAPGMVGFTGSYSHISKDCFYFKGGVSWPNNVFPLTTKGGGDQNQNDYYGADITWYKGNAFARPIWDGQNVEISGNVKSFFISTANNTTLNNIELTGYYARNCNFGTCPMVMWYGVTKQIADNLLVQNFNVRDEVSDGNAIIFQSATDSRDDNVLINSEIVGDPESYITVTRAVNTVKNNKIHDAIGIIYPNGSGEISGNLIYNCGYPKFPTGSKGHHADVIQTNPPNYSATPEQTYLIHDNVIFNTGVDDTNGNECETMLIGNPGENYYIWNNVIYNAHGNGIGLLQDSSNGGPAKSIYIWNNTIVGSRDFSGPCIRSGAGTQIIKIQDNHCITNNSFLYQVSATSFTQDHNLIQTPTQATLDGYSTEQNYPYSPITSSSPTVGTGINLTNQCTGNLISLCKDTTYAEKRTSNTRPSSGNWNIGAYEYISGTPPATKPGDVNKDNKVDITDLSILLTNWKKYYQPADFKVDSNNTIDIFDLSILLSNWSSNTQISACPVTTPNVADGPDPWGGCFPGPKTTGIPANKVQTLSNFVGTGSDPCAIKTDNQVIENKIINCNPLEIQADNVTIKNSKINGQIYINSDYAALNNLKYSLILEDSEVNAPMVEEPAVFEGTMSILRSNIQGGITSVQCGDKAANCEIVDSYLHGQLIKQQTTWHLGAFHSIGGSNYTMTHNYIVCDQTYTYEANNDSGGCSGDIVFIPYDKNISNAKIRKNLLGANPSIAYCLYGGDKGSFKATYMEFTDNIFQRGGLPNGCGDYGPVTGTNIANTGNVWSNNKWDDGGNVNAAL